jgi:hypothetical protein
LHHSQIVSSILGVRQLFIFKQLSLAFVAATIAIITVQAQAVQAAIVGGRVTGIWQSNPGPSGGLNIGDTFTADYTFDDSKVMLADGSIPYARLLSMVVNSGGNFSYTFNSTRSTIVTHTLTTSTLYAEELNGGYFNAMSQIGAMPDTSAVFSFGPYGRRTSNASTRGGVIFSGALPYFTPPASVPTPALLPGLIGMGVGLLRKRRQVAEA